VVGEYLRSRRVANNPVGASQMNALHHLKAQENWYCGMDIT